MQAMAQAEGHRQEEHYKPVGEGNWAPGKRGVADTPEEPGKPVAAGTWEAARFDKNQRA